MLQTVLSVFDKTKSAYLAARESNPTVITGDFNVNLHLHRKNTPERAANASADGKISIALIDIAMIGCIVSAASLLAGALTFVVYVIKKLVD